MITVEQIKARAADAAFGRALVTNVLRGLLVEAIVAAALEPDWEWCSEDYAGWDFQRGDGYRLEVKQSAALQSWAQENAPPSACRWDIAARKGRSEGTKWIEGAGRNAHLYVLAYHALMSSTADHRDPQQWQFFVVRTEALPASLTIGLSSVRKLATSCSFNRLAQTVHQVCSGL